MNEISTLLVVRAQTGDRTALNELLQRLQTPLYAHIVGVLGHDDGADDVLQDVLLIVARKISSVREPKWARAWAYRIANREAVRAAKKERRYRDIVESEYVAEDTTTDDAFSAELRQQLPTLIESLPPAARAVVRLHYLDELSLLEIAEALELPVGTVKSRLAYGLRALRENWMRA